MPAASACPATASACGASGSRICQVRTSCGSPVKAAFIQPSASVRRRLSVPACASPRLVTSRIRRCSRKVSVSGSRVASEYFARSSSAACGSSAVVAPGTGTSSSNSGTGSGARNARRCSRSRPGRGQLIHRGLPGLRHGVVIAGDLRARPADHAGSVALPDFLVFREAPAAGFDGRGGHFQGQGQSAERLGQGACLGGVTVGAMAAGFGGLQQEGRRVVEAQHVQVQAFHAAREPRQAAGHAGRGRRRGVRAGGGRRRGRARCRCCRRSAARWDWR